MASLKVVRMISNKVFKIKISYLILIAILILSVSVSAVENRYENNSHAPDGGYGVSSGASNNGQAQLQTFTVGNRSTNEDFTLSKVQLRLYANQSDMKTYYIRVYIASWGGTKDNLTLSENSTFALKGITTNNPGDWYNVTLPPVTLKAGYMYAIVLKNATNDIPDSVVRWNKHNGGNVYPGGGEYYSSNAGTSYSVDENETNDFGFEVYGTTGSTSTPTTLSISYPSAATYLYNLSSFNYTYNAVGNCRYSRDGGTTNSSTVTSGINFSSVTSVEGSNTWKVYCNDSSNIWNVSSVTFTKNTSSFNLSWLTFNNTLTSETITLSGNTTRWITFPVTLGSLRSAFINFTGVGANYSYLSYVGGTSVGSGPYRIKTSQGVAFSADLTGDRLDIVNITNSTPYAISYLTDSTYLDGADAIKVSSDLKTAYMLGEYSGYLTSINITNLSNPTRISSVYCHVGGMRGLFVDTTRNIVFAVGYQTGTSSNAAMYIFNATNPAAITLISNTTNTGGDLNGARGIYVVGNVAYIAADGYGLTSYDISNLAAPSKLGDLAISGALRDVWVYNGTAFAIGQSSGLKAVNVSNSASFVLLSTISTGSSSGRNVIGDGRYVYYTDEGVSFVRVVDALAPASMTTMTTLTDGSNLNGVSGIDIFGDYLWLTANGVDKIAQVSRILPSSDDVRVSINGVSLWNTTGISGTTQTSNLSSGINSALSSYINQNNYTIPLTFSGSGSVTYSGMFFSNYESVEFNNTPYVNSTPSTPSTDTGSGGGGGGGSAVQQNTTQNNQTQTNPLTLEDFSKKIQDYLNNTVSDIKNKPSSQWPIATIAGIVISLVFIVLIIKAAASS